MNFLKSQRVGPLCSTRAAVRTVALLVGACAAALFTSLSPTPVHADVTLNQVSPKLSVSGKLRTRWEMWNWFEPSGTQDNDYDYLATMANLALKWQDEAFDVVLETQNSALIDLPRNAVAPAPQGALGLGHVYLAHNRRRSDTSIFLKQAFLTFKNVGIQGLSVKGGRFNFAEGVEVLSADPTLDWLKKFRLSQRLIGSFGWSHVGRSFDGLHASYTSGPYNFTLMASHPTEGGFDLAGMDHMDDVDLVYTSFNLTRPSFAEHSDGRLFYIYYADGRELAKTDNRPAAIRGEDRRHIAIHTGGGHWISVLPTSRGPVDLLAWGVVQGGDWGKQDHHGWAWALETGWQPNVLPWKPWFRIGYNRSSGDDDPTDGDHETFFQILPTPRIYSFSTFYNLMNSEDAFVQAIFRPRPGLVWRTDFHNIRVTEGRDLWYQGAGATLDSRNVGFGYVGRPAAGRQDLLRLVETSLSYDWNQYVNLSLYYTHVFGGSVVRSIFAGDHADFGYIEVTFKL